MASIETGQMPRGWYRTEDRFGSWRWWDGSGWTSMRTLAPGLLDLYAAVICGVVILWTVFVAGSAVLIGHGSEFPDPGGATEIDWVAGQRAQLEVLVVVGSTAVLLATIAVLVTRRPFAFAVVAMSATAETWLVATAGWILEQSARFHHVEPFFAGTVRSWTTAKWVLAAATVASTVVAGWRRDGIGARPT